MPELEYVFDQSGPLGMKLVETLAGYTALNKRGTGQAARFDLKKGDHYEDWKQERRRLPHDEIIKLLASSRRPLKIKSARPANEQEEMRYLGLTYRGGWEEDVQKRGRDHTRE